MTDCNHCVHICGACGASVDNPADRIAELTANELAYLRRIGELTAENNAYEKRENAYIAQLDAQAQEGET